ncbi:MAG: TIGR01777 family oxidoreductase [Pseudomonadota bacterium]
MVGLIAGGSGLVGSELGKKLAAKGHTLFVLTRSKEKAEMSCPYPMTPVTWDELDSHPDLKNLDYVVNLVGTSINDKRWSSSFKKIIYSSRVDRTRQLAQWANKSCKNLKCFISTSAIGIYGDTDGEWVPEDHSLSYGFLGQLCQDWEQAAHEVQDTRLAILRVGVVFSEKGSALSEMVPPIQMGVGGPIAGGQQWMSWIDVDDLADMFVFAIEKPIKGVYNAVAPEPATNKVITQTIASRLGKSAFLPVPYFALRAILGPMAKHIIENQKLSSQKIQDEGFQFTYPNVESSIKKRVPQLKGMQRRLIFEQWVPSKKEEVFPFFAEAKNLEQIPPPSLNFHILDSSTEKIQLNTIFNYKLKIDGIPVRWRTLIKAWDPPHFFADNQEKGPYRKWYHEHYFKDLAGGTLMTDQVDLEIPLGWLGYGAASWKVLRDVKNIFRYRREVIHKKYN